MNYLRKLIFISFVFVIFVLQTKAQSEALFPFEGATHYYTWNGLKEGLGYEFYLTDNISGSEKLIDENYFEFDFIDSPIGYITSDNFASVSIHWNNGSSNHIYRIWLEISNPESGCSNRIFVVVSPQPNAFDVLSANIPVDNTESCPAVAATDGFNPVMGPEYSLGVTTLAFKVSREGGSRDWSFLPTLTSTPLNDELNIVSLVVTAGTETQVLMADASGNYTVPGQFNEVIVTVSVANLAGTDQVITLTATNQKEEGTLLNDSNPSNDAVNHTITVMPLIRGMEGV